MDQITIKDIAVTWRVGVTEQERSTPQALRLTIEMDLDFNDAAKNDDLQRTIDYFAVTQRLRQWGENKSWKLIERLALEAAELVLAEFHPAQASVEVKKFILPDTDHVSVRVVRKKMA